MKKRRIQGEFFDLKKFSTVIVELVSNITAVPTKNDQKELETRDFLFSWKSRGCVEDFHTQRGATLIT